MKNLFKNTLRGLWKNKVAAIGLAILIFFSTCIYTLLSSTTTNISSEYNRIAKNSNLHDLTINEKYEVGNIKYTFIGSNGGEQTAWFTPGDDLIGQSTEEDGTHQVVSWGKYIDNGDGTYTKFYRMELDLSGMNQSSLAYQAYTNLEDHPQPYKEPIFPYIFPTVSIVSSSVDNLIAYEAPDAKPEDLYKTAILGHNREDIDQLTKALQGIANYFASYITDYFSPIKEALDSEQYKDKIEYRNFKSLDIGNADPQKYYKMVVSHSDSTPTEQNADIHEGDKIDKMSIFNGMNNFSDYDWQLPGLNKIDGVIPTIGDILSYQMPQAPPAKGTPEYSKTINKFIALSKGDTDVTNINFDNLAGGDFSGADYNNYYQLQTTELFYNKGYRYTLNWTSGSVPHAYHIDDWTSKFSVINPQYASRNNLSPAPSTIFSSYEHYDKKTTARSDIIDWLNNLKQDDFDEWFQWVQNNFKSNVIDVANGTPYVILGTGITADFLYPIVSIERPTPNFSAESINFITESGYNRIYDSFRSNPTEKYISCKLIGHQSLDSMIEKLQGTCNEIMNWPANTRCVYAYNDTNNHLSAAAFRIAFIPRLVEAVSSIDIILTIFVLILCLLICGTIVRRDVEVNRSNIGVMQANGIQKKMIAFMMLPFVVLPTIVGTILGYIFGLFLQIPTLSLLSNYWTIPTATLGFDPLTLFIMILVPLGLLMLVSIISVYIVLRVKTTYLMKSGSEYRVNLINKFIKKPFNNFNIIVRFRISLAFNSWWKLITLSFLTALTMSSLVFSITLAGKFDQSINVSNNAKNYAYSIDLFTPTEQSGQYIPTNANEFAKSGWIKTNEGTNWMPNVYYQDEITQLRGDKTTHSADEIVDDTTQSILKNGRFDYDALGNGTTTQIAKSYYDISASQGGEIPFLGVIGAQNNPQSWIMNAMGQNTNTIYPTGADAVGQAYDLFYLKNRTITKTVLDHDVGSTKTGYSNPWNYAASLMPENQFNRISAITDQILQLAYMKACPNEYNKSSEHPSIDLPGYNHNDADAKYINPYSTDSSENKWMDEQYDKFFNWTDDQGNFLADYSLNIDKVTDSFNALGIVGTTNLTPDYIQFLNKIYSELEWPDLKGNINPNNPPFAINEDYQVKYNQIPMEADDETYTYLDITGSRIKNKMTSDNAKVIGIKKDTSCVSLLSGKKDIHQLIYDLPQNISKDTHFPIIINKYAQRKYGLNVGNEITLNVNNTSDHYSKALRDPNNTPTPDKFNFKVVGINDTYINEEFYISQDVANYILGLKTHLLDDNTTIQNGPHSYYPDTTKSIQIHGENLSRNRTTSPAMQMATEDELILNDVSHFPTTDYYYDNDGARTKPDGLPINNYPGPDNTDPLKTLINPGVKYDVDNLYDINDNNPETRITNDIDDCNITPYGFNGVFTKNPDGDYLLTNCAAVYSPTGLYPGNDKMSDETLRPLLKYGANLQIASQVLGLWISPDNPNNTDLGNEIYNTWRAWMYDGNEDDGWTIKKEFYYDTAYTDDEGVWHDNGDTNYRDYISHIDGIIKTITTTFGGSSVVSLVQNASSINTTQSVLHNAVLTINEIQTIILCVVLILTVVIIMLLTSLIINSTRRLAGILKSLGYRDHINITSLLSIYFPTILIGLIIAIPLSYAILSIFTSLVFNMLGILLLTSPLASTFAIAGFSVLGLYLLFGIWNYRTIKKERLTEAIKWI